MRQHLSCHVAFNWDLINLWCLSGGWWMGAPRCSSLEIGGNQAVGGIGGIELATGAIGLVTRGFKRELRSKPALLRFAAIRFHRPDRGGNPNRRQNAQHFAANGGIGSQAAEIQTGLAHAMINVGAATMIARDLAPDPAIGHVQLAPAYAAADQSGKQRAAAAHSGLSRETVRRRLAENELKPWRQDMWCIPEVDGAYVARMEDVLDLCAEPPDPKRPVVCFDESPAQLIGEVRQPIPAAPGQPRRYDYEYRRNGTVNLFVFLDAHRPWRKVKVTAQRTAREFAERMRDLVDVHYPQADLVRVVMDNLSTHTAGALYEAFPAPEAHRIIRRLEFHYTPEHASWLNMVEIEIGVLRGQCLNQRIGERQAAGLADCRLGETTQQSQSSHQVDVHCGARPHQIGARLSRPNKES